MIPTLDTADHVHHAMMRGIIPRISMSQCAHTWGAKAVIEFNNATQLRIDLQRIADALWEFSGASPLQQAQAAVECVERLRRQLRAAESHDDTGLTATAQNEKEAERAKDLFKRWYHENPKAKEQGHEEIARQETRLTGPQQERADCEEGSAGDATDAPGDALHAG